MASTKRDQSSIRKVLVLGDNRLSTSIVTALTSSDLEVHLATHTQSLTESTSTLTVHKTDSTSSALTSLFQTIQPEILFSTQSAGSYDHQKSLIDAAIATSIPRFVAAEWSHDSSNEVIQDLLPPYKERARVVTYLREQAQIGKIEWTAVATGCDLERALVSSNLGFDVKWQSATIHGTGAEMFAASSSAWPGTVAIAMIQQWSEIKNQYLYVPGMLTNANEILDKFQSSTGEDGGMRQKWESDHVDVKESRREAEGRMQRGFPDAAMFLMERAVLFDEEVGAVKQFQNNDGKQRLGLQAEMLDILVRNVVHEVKHHGNGGCGCD
ncbi:unnamed protein product [Zymoseptoria tritici ST99CH_3D1]|nr:unnamed protein product [Zymoseptoria tritici ST99CH_3D1]